MDYANSIFINACFLQNDEMSAGINWNDVFFRFPFWALFFCILQQQIQGLAFCAIIRKLQILIKSEKWLNSNRKVDYFTFQTHEIKKYTQKTISGFYMLKSTLNCRSTSYKSIRCLQAHLFENKMSTDYRSRASNKIRRVYVLFLLLVYMHVLIDRFAWNRMDWAGCWTSVVCTHTRARLRIEFLLFKSYYRINYLAINMHHLVIIWHNGAIMHIKCM